MHFAAAFFLVTPAASVLSVTAQEDPCLHRTLPVNALTEKGLRYASLTSDELKAYSTQKRPEFCPSSQTDSLPV